MHVNRGQGRMSALVGRSDPARKLAPDQRLDHVHAVVARIETGERGEVRTTRRDEIFLAADRQFLERFQAIGGKPGRGDGGTD